MDVQWCRNRGGQGGHWPPQYFSDQLTLFEPGRADYTHLLLLAPPKFFTFRQHWVVFKQNGIAVLSTRYRIFSIWRCELQFKIYKRAGTVQKDNSKTTADNHSSLKSLTEINLWLNRNYSNTTKEMCITERTSRPFYSYTHIWNHRLSPKEGNKFVIEFLPIWSKIKNPCRKLASVIFTLCPICLLEIR